MIANKKEFTLGLSLLAAFFIVLVIMFQPLFDGKNSMAYLDAMYNSISKSSVYYVPSLRESVKELSDQEIDVKLTYGTEIQADQSVQLFEKAGANVSRKGKTLAVKGAVGSILSASLDDADLMYHNNAKGIGVKYDNLEPRRVTFNWWTSLGLIVKDLNSKSSFELANLTTSVNKKAIETAYNYFGVEPLGIMDEIGKIVFSLVFYVFYTLWYGFAILFAFEGWGLKLSH